MKKLLIIRGCPSAGKTTLAQSLTREHYEADMFFERGNGYEFDPTKLREAHQWCRDLVMMAMMAKKKGAAKMAGGGMPMKNGKPAFIGDGKGMKKGGMSSKMGAVKTGSTPNGVASKGKTKGKMIKMNMGGKAC